MNWPNNDALHSMTFDEVHELRDFYFGYKDKFPHIYSFLKTAVEWMTTHHKNSGITVYSVEGDWRNDGTFIALLQFSCYDIFLHSLEESGNKLRKGLTSTKEICWSLNSVLFYSVHENFIQLIHEVLEDIEVPIEGKSTTYLWQIMEDEALELSDIFENNDFYLDAIKPEDAEVINEVWPPRYEGSLRYLKTFIRRNGGYGIYEKASGTLVSWILHNILGQLGVLQTKDGYFKMGFAAALTRKLAKDVARNENHPIGTVHEGNIPSEALFKKIGFERKFKCFYIRTEKRTFNNHKV